MMFVFLFPVLVMLLCNKVVAKTPRLSRPSVSLVRSWAGLSWVFCSVGQGHGHLRAQMKLNLSFRAVSVVVGGTRPDRLAAPSQVPSALGGEGQRAEGPESVTQPQK